MIAKAKAIAHGVVSLNYITRKGDAPVVKLNHLPSDATPQAIWAHMHLKQMLREQELQCRPLKNNLIRMEISPSKEESKGWTLDDWRQFVDEYVQAFDAIRLYKEKDLRRPPCYLSNSQYIVTLHTDSDSGIPHLHLDCNRVDMDGNLNSDHMIRIRAVMAAQEINKRRGWMLPEDRSKENKERVLKACISVLQEIPKFSWARYSAGLKEKGYLVKLRKDEDKRVRGYTVQTGNSVYKSSDLGWNIKPSTIEHTWVLLHKYKIEDTVETKTQTAPQLSFEERYKQMSPDERVKFALSDEGKNLLFPFGVAVEGRHYETRISGSVTRALYEDLRRYHQAYPAEEVRNSFQTAILLIAGQIDAATTFAENCGGGGSAPDQDWGRDKNEDDILWARRCFRKAHEMVTTPVRRGWRR